jgi:hypothetical protein
MPLERQQRIVAHHAHAVVGKTNQTAATGLDVQAELGCAGIERIFEQFFDDASGTLDHLSRGDFVGNDVGKNADAAHAEGSLPLGRGEDGVDGKAAAEEQGDFLHGFVGDGMAVRR